MPPPEPTPGGQRRSPERRRGAVRAWSSAADAARGRRPTDVALALVAALAVVGLAALGSSADAVDAAVADLATATSGALTWVWSLGYSAVVAWAALLALLPVFSRGRRRLVVELAAAGLLAWGGAAIASIWVDDLALLAVAVALIVTLSPHLAYPLRVVGRATVAVGVASAVALIATSTGGGLVSIALGGLAAAVTHLLFGTPAGLPTAGRVEADLVDLGLDVDEVQAVAGVMEPGVCVMTARIGDGRTIRAKVHGRDAWDGQLVGSLWTTLTRKGASPALVRSRVERTEHEAAITLLAERAQVPVVPIVTVGVADTGDSVIVTESLGDIAFGVSDGTVDDATIASAWQTVATLHGQRIAHRDLRASCLRIGDERQVLLCDLDAAALAPDDSAFAADRARLIAITALAAGPDRALAAAHLALGDGMADALPFLQPPVMDRATRDAVEAGAWGLDDLRQQGAALLGIDLPPLTQVRRVTVKAVVIVLLLGLMAYTLIGMFAGVDLASVIDALAGANYAVLLVALLMSPLVQVALAFSTLGASPSPLRYRPVLMLQYAIQFIALTLPSTAARLALEIRFFQRFGLAAGTAVTIGIVDSVSGFAVQIALILLILLSGLPSLTTSLSSASTTSASSGSHGLIWLIVAILVITLVVSLAVPRMRHRLFGLVPRAKAVLREQATHAKSSLVVLRQPKKVLTMLAGNFGAQVIQAIVLGVCLAAFGESAHLSQLILINTAVSLLGGLMPVPGNMGVAEAGYTWGLQAIGVPTPIAMGTAIAFRLVTFYLPPLWGALSMRWLRRNEYV